MTIGWYYDYSVWMCDMKADWCKFNLPLCSYPRNKTNVCMWITSDDKPNLSHSPLTEQQL